LQLRLNGIFLRIEVEINNNNNNNNNNTQICIAPQSLHFRLTCCYRITIYRTDAGREFRDDDAAVLSADSSFTECRPYKIHLY